VTIDVEVFPDAEWASSVAARFAEQVGGGDHLCLATGNTTKPLYAEIARRTSLRGLTLFLLDEFGGLPQGDTGRCMSMLDRDLLRLSRGQPDLFWPDVDAIDASVAAAAYGDLVASAGLDLALVGLGANGHVGMNEPGSAAGDSTRVVSLATSTIANAANYGATAVPTWGITVGISELTTARDVWLLVTGRHKRDILSRTLDGPIGSEVPATFLRHRRRLTVFVDESARGD
jgi:glucosamine-6-phosphate deaminase